MKVIEKYKEVCRKFYQGKIEAAESEARFLICDTLSFSLSDFYMRDNEEIDGEKEKMIDDFCERRLRGEPLQYISGKWDFMGRSYIIGPGVLIPRPETEILCEKVIENLKNDQNTVVYDLCAGSGCIGVTLKCNCPEIQMLLVEKSDDALLYLLQNTSAYLKNTFYSIIKGDVLHLEDFESHPLADVIVSNPPYIKTEELSMLQREVTFEPEMALDGGQDGLVFYRYIIYEWSKMLKPDGEFFFEIGEDQGEAVCKMLEDIGFHSRIIKDYNNLDRIVTGRKKPYDI